MKVVEMIIDETKDWSGVVEALSLTDTPAIEEEFIALSEEPQEVELSSVNEERRILMGAVLVPEKKILRKNEDGYYQIKFSKETISRASQLFLEKSNQGNSTLEHEIELSGQTVVESWIVEDDVHDKSRAFGIKAPVGSWMVSMKVDNDEIWNDYVKTGKVKGFSIEALFSGKTMLSAQEESFDYIGALDKLKELLNTEIKE